MTIVQIKAHAPTSEGEAPAPGVLEWVPTHRRNSADVVVLPAPFKVRLVSGAGSVNVHATGPDWVWKVTESLAGLPKVTRYVAVPDEATVDYNALVEVDPDTLDPAGTPEPIWYAYVDALAETAAQAQAEAVAAATGFSIGTVTTSPSGSQAEASISGQAPNRKLNLGLPQGPPLQVSVADTVTGPESPGTKGDKGDKGDRGDPGGFVLGTALGITDLNTVTTPGIYRQSGAPSAGLNYPVLDLGVLTVHQSSTVPWVVQEYMVTATLSGPRARLFYRRTLVSGTWSAWMVYTSTRVDQSGGRVIYQWDDLNSREQVIFGDTGWREVPPLSGTASWIRLRRMGNIVHVWIGGWMNGTSADIVALPAGFQTGTNSMPGHWGDRNGAPVAINVNGPSSLVQAVSGASAVALFGYISFATVNSWPTTLPGTPHAAIPNL